MKPSISTKCWIWYWSLISLLVFLLTTLSFAECQFVIGQLKYNGGGDWYANPSALPNLVQTVKERTKIPICDTVAVISIMEDRLFYYPFITMTGHGNIHFSPEERLRLREYLTHGGFLWADDNYGMDKSFRKEITALFPDNPLTPIGKDHPVFSSKYSLPSLPKIHEHDGALAQAYGIFFNDRLIVFYTFSSDIGDGMEDLHVHNDGKVLHEAALRMGVNIVSWFFDP